MICLNSVMELMTRASTTFLQVGTSTPVVSIWEVVTMAGVVRLQFHEAVEVPAADLAFIGDDAGDVVGVLFDEVGVEVVQGLAHLLGVLLVNAEDDGLAVAVGLLQEVGQVAGDGLGAGFESDDPFKVLRAVVARPGSPGRSDPARPCSAASRPRPQS